MFKGLLKLRKYFNNFSSLPLFVFSELLTENRVRCLVIKVTLIRSFSGIMKINFEISRASQLVVAVARP